MKDNFLRLLLLLSFLALVVAAVFTWQIQSLLLSKFCISSVRIADFSHGYDSFFFILINLGSESFDLIQLMTHNGFARIDSNQLATPNGFLIFDSNRLPTLKASRTFWFKSTYDSKSFPGFWFKSTHDSKISGILIRIKSWLNDSNQLLISLTFFGVFT